VLYVILWWLIAQMLGWLAVPLAFRFFRWLPDRGYTFAKAVGLLLASYLLWAGASIGFLGNDSGGILFAILLAGALSAGVYLQGEKSIRPLLEYLRQSRRLILVIEILFTLAFAAWVLLRAYAPEKIMSAGGEKFMEIAFLNGVLNSSHFPPLDPWLSGFSISYYYFGYVMMGLLTRLSGAPAAVGFDLYDALLFALTVVGGFGVVYNLVRGGMGSSSPAAEGKARLFGMLGGLFVAVLGNLEGLLEAVYSKGILPASFWTWLDIPDLAGGGTITGTWLPSGGGWWWWRASRVLQDRDLLYRPMAISPISEFPFFSFLLGDNHPHVLALPFVLLSIAVALNFLRWQLHDGRLHADGEHSSSWNPVAIAFDGDWVLFLFSALFLGSLGFLNTWDLPIYLGLAAAAYAVGIFSRSRRIERTFILRVVVFGLSLGAAALLLYAFFYVSFSSQAGGLLPYVFPPTRLSQYLVMFGPFVFILGGFLLANIAGSAGPGVRRRRLASFLKWWGGILLVSALLFGVILAGISASSLARQFIQEMNSDPNSPFGGMGLSGLLQAIILYRGQAPWLWLFLSGLLALGLVGFIQHLHSPQEEHPAFELESVGAESPGVMASHLFVYLLILAGLLLTFSTEFFYLRDNFGVRMNTVFKFYYQAWVMMGSASAYALWWVVEYGASSRRVGLRTAFLAGSGALILAGMVYPLLAYPSRAHSFQSQADLNGAANIAQGNPDDWAVIEWLKQNGRRPDGDVPVILEAPGKSYNYEGRISAFTGFPAVLGWSLHEGQWRGSYDEQTRREQDIATIYTTSNGSQAVDLLNKWNVTYVIVGNPERQYVQELCNDSSLACNPARALAKFDTILKPVYQKGSTTVYQVP
jgi:YYY domain-containing protein